jgi:hypothetical protein
MRGILYSILLALALRPALAQETEVIERDFIETRDIRLKESLLELRGVAAVPNVMSSVGFRSTFKGIYDVSAALTIRIARGFRLGVGIKNALVSTAERVQNLDTRMQLYTGFVKPVYNHFHNERSYSSFAVNIGYNNSFFTHLKPLFSPILSKEYNSVVFEPEYSINFAVEENFTIGIYASYQYMPTPYNAVNIAMQDYTPSATAGANQGVGILNVGFCFYVGMGQRFKPNLPE